MEKMDPWTPLQGGDLQCSNAGIVLDNNFEDNFTDSNVGREMQDNDSLKLADSDSYLNKLYGKLSRLQHVKSGTQLLTTLQEARGDHWAHQLNSSSCGEQFGGDAVSPGYLQRRLLPHTVPQSREELLRLLETDQLQERHQAEQQETDQLQERHQAGQQETDQLQERHQAEQLETDQLQERHQAEQLETDQLQERHQAEQLQVRLQARRQETQQESGLETAQDAATQDQS